MLSKFYNDNAQRTSVSAFSTVRHFKYGHNFLIFGRLFMPRSQNSDILSTFGARKYGSLDVIKNTGHDCCRPTNYPGV